MWNGTTILSFCTSLYGSQHRSKLKVNFDIDKLRIYIVRINALDMPPFRLTCNHLSLTDTF